MYPRDGRPTVRLINAAPDAANDADPFDGVGPGDWGDQWIDNRLMRLFEADAQVAPSPRLAELLLRLEASLERDRQA